MSDQPRQDGPRQDGPPPSGEPGRPASTGRGGQGGQGGADLVGDLQRWLIRSGAKNVRREIGGQVRRKLGGDRSEPQDVWDTATTEIPPGDLGEAPECAWCPVCRAARRIRESGPGLGSQLSGAGDAVAAAVQEALSLFDGVLSRTGSAGGTNPRGATARAAGRSDTAGPDTAGPDTAEPEAADPGTAETDAARPESAGQDAAEVWSAAVDDVDQDTVADDGAGAAGGEG